MDPNVALRELRLALASHDFEAAEEAFEALDEWLGRGGFYPSDWSH